MKPFLLLFLFTASSFLCFSQRNYAEHTTIIRDSWGVPHIYGDTDADVAYGLAWANAEDDFQTMQETLLPAKGMLARWKGKSGAVMDFVVDFMGSKQLAMKDYEKVTDPKFDAYLKGYCQGINDYALAHPKEVKVKKAFPITPQDVVASFHYLGGLITAFHEQAKGVLEGKYDTIGVKFASNAFAINKMKSQNGNTLLTINPHIQFEGMFSWYEAHLVSNEGMDIMGALFHGGTSIFVGTNRNLGWAHTWNKYDLVDTYKLKMHPKNKLKYEFDGKWLDLEEKKVKLKVKISKLLPILTVTKKYFHSVLGPVLKSPSGDYYAFRWGAMNELRTSEQWWKMNKAKNFSEFYNCIEMNALPRFNIVYADKNDTIFYIDNGIVPKRDKDFNWKGILPGNTSDAVWKETYATNELPQSLNPDCGYVSNMNNTPFSATCEEGKMPLGQWDPHMNFRLGDNNRSLRFMEFMEQMERVSYEDMKTIKFDNQYPKSGKFLESIAVIYTTDANKFPEYSSILKKMQEWDKKAEPKSIAATYYLLAFNHLFSKYKFNDENFLDGFPMTETMLVEALEYTKSHLLKYFGTLEVPLEQIQVVKRGNEEYPMPGFPDALAANYSKLRKSDGKYVGYIGDTYTMFVEYDNNGVKKVETLLNYGVSAHPESPHYTDQLKIWVKQQVKPMSFDKAEILKNAERTYHPGIQKKSKN